jgi:hypothetical protein
MIDTMILQWGLFDKIFPNTRISPNTNIQSVTDVKAWIEECTQRKDRLLLSTIVVGQALVAQPIEIHEELLKGLQKFFPVYPYNDVASRRFAELHIAHIKDNKQILNEIKANSSRPDQSIKIDMMVLGHAIATKVDAFYTCNDKEIRKLAKDKIEVRYPKPNQPTLF